MHLCFHRHFGRDFKEFLAVFAGQVSYRTDDALFPEQIIREGGNFAHVDAAADHHTSLGRGFQGFHYQRTYRRKDQGRIELLRGLFGRTACPYCTKAPGEFLGFLISRPGKGIDLLTLMLSHLGNDMRRSTKAVYSQPLYMLARQTVGAEANQSCA